jgi:hypothetical protein
MSLPVTYTYTVNFKDIDTTQRPGKLTSAPQTVLGDLDINPRVDLYSMTTIPIRAYSLPWDRYPSAEVEVRYADPANALNQQVSMILTSAAQELDWTMFTVDRTKRSFDYRVTYHLANGTTTVTQWVTNPSGKLDLFDPFPSKLKMVVMSALDWIVYDQALVFVAYPSKDNPESQQTYTFNKALNTAQTFEVERKDTSQNLIYYEIRLIRSAGGLTTVPGSVTSDPYLIVQDGMKGHQILSIVPESVEFGQKQIGEIDVQLRYVDAKNSLNITKSFTISKAGDAQTFTYDYVNSQISPEGRYDIKLTNGQTKSADWAPVSGMVFTIPLSQLD